MVEEKPPAPHAVRVSVPTNTITARYLCLLQFGKIRSPNDPKVVRVTNASTLYRFDSDRWLWAIFAEAVVIVSTVVDPGVTSAGEKEQEACVGRLEQLRLTGLDQLFALTAIVKAALCP